MWWGILIASTLTLIISRANQFRAEKNCRQAWRQALGRSFLEKEIFFSKEKLANLAHDKRFAELPEEFYEAKRYLLMISPSQLLLYYKNSKEFILVPLSHKKLAFLLEEAMCDPDSSNSTEHEEKESNIVYFVNYQKRVK